MDESARQVVEETLWVLRCCSGEAGAFVSLYRRYHRPVLYFIRKMLKDPEAAADLSQEVWVKAYRGIRKLREPDRFRPWLYRIARNEVLQELRRKAREPEWLDLPYDIPEQEPDVLYRPEDAERVNQALDQLSMAHRECLVLYFLHGMSYDEIAEALECGIGTVRSRLHYAKRSLREQLERMNHEA